MFIIYSSTLKHFFLSHAWRIQFSLLIMCPVYYCRGYWHPEWLTLVTAWGLLTCSLQGCWGLKLCIATSLFKYKRTTHGIILKITVCNFFASLRRLLLAASILVCGENVNDCWKVFPSLCYERRGKNSRGKGDDIWHLNDCSLQLQHLISQNFPITHFTGLKSNPWTY